jgi:ribosomal protein S18 acetylase RimI-like enzyme
MTSPSTYDLRRPRAADAPGFAALHARIWRTTYRGLMSDSAVDDLSAGTFLPMWESIGSAYDEARVPSDGREFWVATLEQEPVGFLLWGPPREEDPPAPRQLWALNVSPDHHGTGLAQRLMDEVFGPGPAYLWVARGNDRAVRFYRRNGFELDGGAGSQDGDGMVELRMVRPG